MPHVLKATAIHQGTLLRQPPTTAVKTAIVLALLEPKKRRINKRYRLLPTGEWHSSLT